jgi:putative membrane protein
MRLLIWLLRAFVFFALFAFALNNQHEVQLKWFFGYEWRAPMVFVVLAALMLGVLLGVLGMLPGWWHHRRRARRAVQAIAPAPEPKRSERADQAPPADVVASRLPPDGL